jgi:catecholate siderophore receptor
MRCTLSTFVLASALAALPAAAAPPADGVRGEAQALVTIHGSVLDATGAPISGARVTAVGEGQIPAASTVTKQSGDFTLTVEPGRYTVRAIADGFLEGLQRITATTGTVSAELVLQVEGVHEAVTVTAPALYGTPATSTATKTLTPLRDVPQSVTVVTEALMRDQLMTSLGDVMRYVPGVMVHQGENNRDQVVMRGNTSSADFFVNGLRDDVQYYRDLYNLDRVETLKGPNAMIFGRGGAGGVVNRVTKEAQFQALREVSLQAGMYDNRRLTADLDQPINDTVAVRLNGVYENSGSFRNFVGLERYGVTPTVTVAPSDRTRITLTYEYLNDSRTADRGITSFQGLPADVDAGTFYGNPSASDVKARVNIGSGRIEHRIGNLTLRNTTLVANYDRSYQNFVPGAVTADQSQVALSAYNNATNRTNVFNQTDATYARQTGRVTHTLVAGAELGRQLTDNFRNTGYFNATATSVLVPSGNPTTSTPVNFRQSPTDADNHLTTNVAAVYGQDQIELSRHVQVLAGVRFDRFDLLYRDNRSGGTLDRPDNLVSPRAGVVYKPIAPVSIYSSYSVSSLPSSGDQFSSLTTVTEQLKPEQFRNYEVGAKWDALGGLSATLAVYRLDRTNTRSTDPNDPTRIVQTGRQRTNGCEIGVNGRMTRQWSIAGGYAYQDASVTSATAAAPSGAVVGQVPHHTLSLWNNYQVLSRVSAALGVVYRSDMFAAIDDTVTLPGYTRVDAAAFFAVRPKLRLQANVENVFDRKYFINADSNTNISPGSPRAIRVGLTAAF